VTRGPTPPLPGRARRGSSSPPSPRRGARATVEVVKELSGHNCFGCDQYRGLVLPTDQEPPPKVTDTLLLVEPSRTKAQRQREIDNLGDVETPDGHEQEGGPSPEPDVRPRPGPAQDPLFRSADTRCSALRPGLQQGRHRGATTPSPRRPGWNSISGSRSEHTREKGSTTAGFGQCPRMRRRRSSTRAASRQTDPAASYGRWRRSLRSERPVTAF
jgi:hypothetical protein